MGLIGGLPPGLSRVSEVAFQSIFARGGGRRGGLPECKTRFILV